MYCIKCGKEVTGKFCTNCGNKTEELPHKENNQIQTIILTIIRCIIGGFIGILCFGTFLSKSILSGILLFIVMVLTIPFSSHFLKSKLNIKIPKPIQAILMVFLFFIAIFNVNSSEITTSTDAVGKTASDESISAKNTKLIAEQKKIEKARNYYNNNNLETAYLECKKIIPTLKESEAIDEANILLSEISSAIPTIKASTLAKEYKDNEVKADIQYKDKFIRVTGVVDSIGKFIDDTYLYLKDGTSYSISKPHFYFSDENEILKVSELKEGDTVSILGNCSGATISSATFYDCIIE